ncbi:MAG: hypothetical protein AAF743_16615, partial [Planctomycetota bacterium]
PPARATGPDVQPAVVAIAAITAAMIQRMTRRSFSPPAASQCDNETDNARLCVATWGSFGKC